MKIFDKRKLRIFLIRHNNLITLLKLFIILTLTFIMNLNRKFISCIFYPLIVDTFMLNKREQRFYKYLLNIMILTMLLSERLLHCSNNFAVIDVMRSILYVFVILIAIKLDLIANRVKYNFTLLDYDLKNIIKKDKVLIFIKMILITSMLLLVKVNIFISSMIGILSLLQLFIGNSEVDRIKKTIMDLIIFLISALSILFKSDLKGIVENLDMIAILGILAVISFYWIAENKKN